MSTTFWTLMIVALNTPQAAVEIRQLPGTPAFQTKASCEDYAKLKGLRDTVCFTGGAPLAVQSDGSGVPDRQANVWVTGSTWGSAKP